MTVPQLAALLAAGACFASYAWGLGRFFWTPPGRAAAGRRAITGATALSMAAHGIALVHFYRPAPAGYALAMPLYAISLAMFWWCVRVNRAQPLSLAFSQDRPDHIVMQGPYAAIRHPFYASYMLCWIAGVLASGQWPLVATVVLMGWIYHRAALLEEAKFASSALAEPYRRYALQTGRYLPRHWPRFGKRA